MYGHIMHYGSIKSLFMSISRHFRVVKRCWAGHPINCAVQSTWHLLVPLSLEKSVKQSRWCVLCVCVEQLYLAQLEERAREKDEMESTAQMKDALEKQMEQHREQHQKQLAELRQEITDKQHRIEELAEYVPTGQLVSNMQGQI